MTCQSARNKKRCISTTFLSCPDGGASPMKMLEYRMVPFLTSIVSIGNDLAASALTRGLNSPAKRTNVCPIGFTWRDGIAFFATICCLIIFIIYR